MFSHLISYSLEYLWPAELFKSGSTVGFSQGAKFGQTSKREEVHLSIFFYQKNRNDLEIAADARVCSLFRRKLRFPSNSYKMVLWNVFPTRTFGSLAAFAAGFSFHDTFSYRCDSVRISTTDNICTRNSFWSQKSLCNAYTSFQSWLKDPSSNHSLNTLRQ